MGGTEWIQSIPGTVSGFPRLEQLCYRVLVRYRDWLGDLGDTPLALVQGILETCSAEKLAEIEDETRLGGRDIGAELAPYWKHWVIKTFGADSVPAIAQDSDAGSTDWRTLYDYKMEEYQEREQAVGQRLRRVAAQCAEQKNSRTMQVIEPVPRRHAHKMAARPGFAAPPPSARHRLLKKLGMHAKAPKDKFLIRPVRRIVQPAPLQPPVVQPSPDKWTSNACQGPLLVESDLDLHDSTPATSPHTPVANPAGGSHALPALTDNRFVHMPPFEAERRVRTQAGMLIVGTSGTVRQARIQSRPQPAAGAGQAARTAAAAQPAIAGSRSAAAERGRERVNRGSHGLDGISTMHPKRPSAALTPEVPAKRRKPELLSASALAAIAASSGPAASARSVSAGGAVRCSSGTNARGFSRGITGPLRRSSDRERARTAPTMGTLKGISDGEPQDEQSCGILVPTDIFS